MKNKFDLLLLFSAGWDSTLLLRFAHSLGYTPFCLIFDYGQINAEEIEKAKNACVEYNVPFLIQQIDIPAPSKLKGDEVSYEGVSSWHVPARNLLFVAYATSVAESHTIPLIWIGANFEDRVKLFPDCYQEWVYHVNNVLAINGSVPIQIEAPLLGMTKPLIKKLAANFGIKQSQIFSGYGEQDIHEIS